MSRQSRNLKRMLRYCPIDSMPTEHLLTGETVKMDRVGRVVEVNSKDDHKNMGTGISMEHGMLPARMELPWTG